MSKGSIGFVGIGMMGLPMASRLLGAGFEVVAYDIRQEAIDKIVAKGAKPAIVVKFRNDAGGTWGGRGKRPTWLRDALNAGKKLEDFAVK